MMHVVTVFLFALAFAMTAPVEAGEARLHARIDAALVEENLTGAVWALVKGDGEIELGAAGVKNAGTGEAMSEDARVHVGSVTKTLIAAGVLRLVTLGELDLDASVSELLPMLSFDNPWRDTDPVRLRHLLDHTAGLDDARLWQMFSAEANPHQPLTDAFIRDPSVLRLRSRPGERFSYSNMGYTLAALALERVTGRRYEAWLEEYLLRPLAMHDSSFGFISQTGPHADERLAWGHNDNRSLAEAVAIVLRPAGQFTTTAADMGKFARFLMGDGSVGGRVLIDRELLRAMGRPRTTLSAKAGLRGGYALGLATRDRHGVVGLCHSGNIVGYRAMLCLYPESNQAFFIAHNTDSESADYHRFDALLIDALDIAERPAVSAVAPAQDFSGWMGHYLPAPNRFAAFRYFDDLFGGVRLEKKDGVLHMTSFGGTPRELVPVGQRLFRASDRREASHVLIGYGDGTRLFSDGQRTYRKVGPAVYWRNWAVLAVAALGLSWFLVAVPVRRLLEKEPMSQPGFIAVSALLVSIVAMMAQPWIQLGDFTVASAALYAATGLLPCLMMAQLVVAFVDRRRYRGARQHGWAALMVLPWCVQLILAGVLPFALWR